jgi:putative ABC transport system permease protein
MKYMPLVFKNLLRNKRRTILTVLSVTVSLFLLGFLLTVYAAFYHPKTSDEHHARLVTRHRVSLTQSLPEYYGTRIRAVDGVEQVCIYNWFGGTYIDQKSEHMFARFAVEAEKVFKVHPEYVMPPEQKEAFLRDRQGMAVEKSIAERLGFQLGQRITLQGDIYPFDMEFVIRAIFEAPANDQSTLFHYKYLQETLPEAWGNQAGIFTILARSAGDVPRIAQSVDDMFRNSPEPTKTETEDAFQQSFVEQIGNIKLFLMCIAGAVMFTIILVSANTMAMSTRERIQEIGVLKTLGFTAPVILTMIVSEAMLIAAVGGLLGTGLSYVVTQALGDLIVGFVTGFMMPLWGVPVCLAVALLIGFFSSVVPAAMASNTRIADALRHTG